MPRPPVTSERVYVTLPPGSLYLLDQLVTKATIGETRAEVAKHLLMISLDALVERGRIKDVGD